MPPTDATTLERSHLDETARVYAEYDAARAAYLDNPTDPLVDARHDRAMAAVFDVRQHWRNIGLLTGTRDQGAAVTDNTDAPAPTLIPQEA